MRLNFERAAIEVGTIESMVGGSIGAARPTYVERRSVGRVCRALQPGRPVAVLCSMGRPFLVLALVAAAAACAAPSVQSAGDSGNESGADPSAPPLSAKVDAAGSAESGVSGAVEGNDAGTPDIVDEAPIVFAAKLNEERYDLYSIRPDGSGLARLTATPDVDEVSPAWAPDRSRISFHASGVPIGLPRFMVRDAEGLLTTVPVPAPTEHAILTVAGGLDRNATRSSWSSDGLKLGFGVVLNDLDSPADSDGRWNWVAIWSSLDGSAHDYVRRATGHLALGARAPIWDGGVIRYLMVCDNQACAGLLWAFGSDQEPSGDWHAYVNQSPMGDLAVAPSGRTWAQTRESSVVVTPPHKMDEVQTLATAAWMPRWSPTERHIAILRADGIYTMRPDGSSQTRILRGDVHSLDW